MTSSAKRLGDLPHDKIELVSNSNLYLGPDNVVAHDCRYFLSFA